MKLSLSERSISPAYSAVYYLSLIIGGSTIGFMTCLAAGLQLKWFTVYLMAFLLMLVFAVTKQRKNLALGLFIFFLPFFVTKKIFSSEFTMLVGGPSSLSIFLYDIPLAILLCYFLSDKVFKRDSSLYIPAVLPPLLLYIIWSGISVINAARPILTFIEFVWLWRTAIILFLLVNIIKDRKDLILVITLLIAGLFLQEVITFIQAYLKKWFTFTGDVAHTMLESTARPDTFRAGGTVGLHNVQASYYVLLLSLTTGIFFANFKSRLKYILLFIILCGILSVILTYSRNGYASLSVSLAIVAILAVRKKIIKIRYFILGTWLLIFIILMIIPLGGQNVINRIKSKAAIEPRIETVKIAFRMVGKHPISGVGLNNFAIVMADKDFSPYGISDLQKAYLGGEYFRTVVHNKYLLVASETGTVGLIFFLWMHYIIYSFSFKLLKSKDWFYWGIGAGMAAALTGALIQMHFDIYNADLLVAIFWALVALTFSAYKISLCEENNLSPSKTHL